MASVVRTKHEALGELAKRGIMGNAVYLLDVLPLVEMAWADGVVQPGERAMILAFLDEHLRQMEERNGSQVVPRAEALRFVDRFLTERPPEEELRHLRELFVAVRLSEEGRAERTQRILDGAMAVGGVAGAPSNPARAWDERELDKLWELELALQRD
jgi:hypothetical protein